MHAERVNWFKARGDQSWFLHVAQVEYRNWHGIGPPQMLRRNIMPLYPAYLALFYDPSISDPDYFVIAKRWSVRLSLALLVALGFVFARYLPALVATNLTLIVAFGYWIFKAGYAQPELLYYFLLFLTFLACCHLLRERRPGRSMGLALIAGALAALTHLTKAAMPLFLGVFFVAYAFGELVRWRQARPADAAGRREALTRGAWRAAAAGVLLACFLAVLLPYISTSKRVFGSYFYNANTTFYVWYDTWGEAGADMKDAGAELEWPKRPPRDLPGPAKYLEDTHHQANGGAVPRRVPQHGGPLLPHVLVLPVRDPLCGVRRRAHRGESPGLSGPAAPARLDGVVHGPVCRRLSSCQRLLQPDLRDRNHSLPHRPPHAVLLRSRVLHNQGTVSAYHVANRSLANPDAPRGGCHLGDTRVQHRVRVVVQAGDNVRRVLVGGQGRNDWPGALGVACPLVSPSPYCL